MKSIDLIENRIGKAGELMEQIIGRLGKQLFSLPKHDLFNRHGYTQNTTPQIGFRGRKQQGEATFFFSTNAGICVSFL